MKPGRFSAALHPQPQQFESSPWAGTVYHGGHVDARNPSTVPFFVTPDPEYAEGYVSRAEDFDTPAALSVFEADFQRAV